MPSFFDRTGARRAFGRRPAVRVAALCLATAALVGLATGLALAVQADRLAPNAASLRVLADVPVKNAYQKSRSKTCAPSPSCRINFTGSGAAKVLRVRNVSCTARISSAVTAFVIQVYDGPILVATLQASSAGTVNGQSYYAANNLVDFYLQGDFFIDIFAFENKSILFACSVSGQLVPAEPA